MTNTDTNLGAFSRSRQQGPRFTVDRVPRTQSKTDPNAGSASIVHTRLHGSIPCTAFGIGPVSLRLSNLTLIVTDRPSALSLVRLHVWFSDRAAIAHLAAPQRQPRSVPSAPLGQVLTAVELCRTSTKGTVRASAARPDRRETSINIGPVRITACGPALRLTKSSRAGLRPSTRRRPTTRHPPIRPLLKSKVERKVVP